MKNAIRTTGLIVAGVMFFSYLFAEKNITDNGNNKEKSTKNVAAGCQAATGSTDLDLNNVRALIHTGGDMWWDLQGSPRYEVPKNSGKHALFAGSIWIGGEDANGQLRLAAVMFRSGGTDYYNGPLIKAGAQQATVTPDVCKAYDRHFKITRNEVERFHGWFEAKQRGDETLLADQYEGYVVPEIIKQWPAHGDITKGYDYYLAPFKDVDGDESYNPDNGDYPFYDLEGSAPCGTTAALRVPRLYGDMTLWWVYNDKGNVHNETNGAAIGMEIRAQSFAFSKNDELNNMTFGNYELINRSTYTLYNTYFGVWTDADMGDPYDDYVGCDVNRGLGYLYNGEDIDGDGNAKTYGKNPPAIGVDFFEGPYMDPKINDQGDTVDRPSSWVNGQLICDANAFNGNINGLNFGDGVPNNERWGMRRFVYFNNDQTVMGNPSTATDFFNYLRGIWRDGSAMRFGGNGHGSGNGATQDSTDFMFPGVPSTDPCAWGTRGKLSGILPWSEKSVNNPPGDRRFIQSAGPFTLEPGAVNDITVGMVWARTTSGSAIESVPLVQRADDKAQKLFENCFKVVDGPDSPELEIIELDKKLIFHIYNIKGTNNYDTKPEDYVENNPFIVCPLDANGQQTGCDKTYKFEGYQVFQLKDATCSVNDIYDPNKSKVVFQCDIKNGVSKIVNFTWDADMEANVPQQMVNGSDMGIIHTFELTDDAFAPGDKRLVNHKTYYFLVIAYAYNNFKDYNPLDPSMLDGQKEPYLAGRKGSSGSIQAYAVIPHKPDPDGRGTILNSGWGDKLAITQFEGHGGGMNALELSKTTSDQIMSGPPWKADSLIYTPGHSPITVQIIDPLNVPEADYILLFDSVSIQSKEGGRNGYIWSAPPPLNKPTGRNAKWRICNVKDTADVTKWIWSDDWVSLNQYEQIIPEWGISVNINQIPFPGCDMNSVQNGFLEDTMYFSNPRTPWLSFIPDEDGQTPQNWIRSGTQKSGDFVDVWDDYMDGSIGGWDDKSQFFEGILNGTWAPYKMASIDMVWKGLNGKNSVKYGVGYQTVREDGKYAWNAWNRYSSIDFVITPDKSKWTRCPVVEMCEYDTTGGTLKKGLSEGGAWKFNLRKHPSVDKNGNYASDTATVASTDENDPAFIGPKGMGWFPGYVIDVETGERLNIMFGEDSRLPGEHGMDMIWNPSPNIYSNLWYQTGGLNGDVLFGGKHYIYVVGHNYKPPVETTSFKEYMPAYDYGKHIYTKLTAAGNTAREQKRQEVWANVIWAALPFLSEQFDTTSATNPYAFIRCDLTVKIRMANPYHAGVGDFRKTAPLNHNWPMYKFSTKGYMPTVNDEATAENALDLIYVVPNPYYGFSEYEESQLDNVVKITNLPQKCTITIYSVNGVKIRQFKKDSPLSYQDWDLKNETGISIASGLYIFHVDVPGLGEKVVKWFGALRPVDLNSF